MRSVLFICIILTGCTATKLLNSIPSNIQGTWKAVQQEMSGKALPKAFYENQQLIISDSNYTVIAESIDKGIVRYSGNRMDIYGKEGVNKGKHFTAIYKFENNLFTICYNLSGTIYPETFETKDKPGFFLSVFKK